MTSVLIDARNIEISLPGLIASMASANIVGIDLETEDSNRHEGLNAFMKTDSEGHKAGNRPLVFDTQRTTICGLSIFIDGSTEAYYFNLNHLDVENRIPWPKVLMVLEAINPSACWVAHNAMFERTMLRNSLGFEFKNPVICTLQMAVSAYGSDEYDPNDFQALPLGPVSALLGDINVAFSDYDGNRQTMTAQQGELFQKFLGKESDAAHSYNGWTKTIGRPYGLKQAVKYWFGYDMQTFEETLAGRAHMGQLTGEETLSYGADDAVWAVQLYHKLLEYMLATNPKVVKAFFQQELPCVEYYSDVWSKGLRVNLEAIQAKRIEERHLYAETLRSMRASIRSLLPFKSTPHEGLMKYDAHWYEKGFTKYRDSITKWATLPETEDDTIEILRVRGAIPIALANDLGKPEPKGLSIAHYMPVRVLFYDLLDQKLITDKGKTQSDGEARGKLIDRFQSLDSGANTKELGLSLLRAMGELASVEQRAKLYLNPYSQLTDPETQRIYPVISSKLATRRTSISTPNGQQLAKRGESKYVRGFYLPDHDDHVIISADWSSIELVMLAELSQDPEFRKAFGQLPYQDLHLGATAACLGVVWEFVTEDYLKGLKSMDPKDVDPRILTDLKGATMKPSAALKYWRTEVGKKANFGYWYSGALSDVGQSLGWTSDQMWAAVEAYRERFSVAEEWRTDTIRFAQEHGYIQLPDGHRRVKYECTQKWAEAFLTKFNWYDLRGVSNFARTAMKSIQTRSGNQTVNAMIQGSCAAMMKRSILRMRDAIKANGWTDRDVRTLIPIHDEMLLSVHKSLVVPAIQMMRECMCKPDIISTMPLTVAPAVGRTFEPYIKGNKNTQIELGELSDVGCVSETRWGQEANDDEIKQIVEWIFEKEAA